MRNHEFLHPESAMPPSLLGERRAEQRENVGGTLWMVDYNGCTVLKCVCIESSPNGMRLRAPLGYGIAEGQRYELRSHLPGQPHTPGFSLVGARWATVVRTEYRVGTGDDHLDIGVTLDHPGSSALSIDDAGTMAMHSAAMPS